MATVDDLANEVVRLALPAILAAAREVRNAPSLGTLGAPAEWKLIPGTVGTTVAPSVPVVVRLAPDVNTSTAQNLTGQVLVAGARVMVLSLSTGALFVIGLRNGPGVSFRIEASAQPAIAGTGTVTKISFDTVIYDSLTGFVAASNSYIIPIAGYWSFDARTDFLLTDATAQRSYVMIYVNGVERIRGSDLTIRGGTGNDVIGSLVSGEVSLNVGDIVTVQQFGATAGSGNINAGTSSAPTMYLNGHLVGPV